MREGLCDDEERKKCEVESGDNLAWACANCPKTRVEDLHPYTHKLLRIHTLRKAGYPLKENDLTYEEWLDLGKVEQWLETPEPLKSKFM